MIFAAVLIFCYKLCQISVSATTIGNDDKYDDNFDMEEEQKQ